MPILEEWVRDHGLDDENNCAYHLGHGFDFAKDGCRYHDAALACYNEAKAGYCKLAKEDHKDYPNEDKRLGGLTTETHPNQDGNHRGKHHKFICKRVDKFAEIGYEIILSRDFSVKHISEGCEAVNNGGNDVAPYGDISHKEERCHKCGNKQTSYEGEGVWNVKRPFFHFVFSHFLYFFAIFRTFCKV